MGMESFFVSVLSSEMSLEYKVTREVIGYDEQFNQNWFQVLMKDFALKKEENYILVNNLIEFHVEKTFQGGIYISLVGCLSCIEEASGEMDKIITKISNVILGIPNVFIFGNIYPYDEKNFMTILKSNYGEKKKKLDLMYPERIVICPSKFYKRYKKNDILSKIKRCFVKNKYL